MFTKEQVEAQNRRFPVPGSMRNAKPPPGIDSRTVKCLKCEQMFDLRESHVCAQLDPWGKMNKTEREFLNTFMLSQPDIWSHIEREAFKLRIGPPKQRCTYTPDFSGFYHGAGSPTEGHFAIVETKGNFEREDARVKRMAAARWCLDRKIGFLFAQKTKAGWQQTWLA